MTIAYEEDIAGWAEQQAQWLRTGSLTLIDREHLAEEIEDITAYSRYQLQERCATLMAHLARWQRQSEHRCGLWRRLIELQRLRIGNVLRRTPSLRRAIPDADFLEDVWLDALIKVIGEDSCFDLPDASPWSLARALDQDFFPN